MWATLSHLVQALPAETAHKIAVKTLRLGLAPVPDYTILPVSCCGLSFDNPLGLAAGFDKNAECYEGAFRLGFGAVEVGTITPEPQPGNPRPRVFRLPEDNAVINRYGLNSRGMTYAASQLARRKQAHRPSGILGVNIGANKLSTDKTQDYYMTSKRLCEYADYLTVNLSSPNTPGLRDLQHEDALIRTLDAVFQGCSDGRFTLPVFVKLAPDLNKEELVRTLDLACERDVGGFVLTNTTIERPDGLKNSQKNQPGGLSGAPLTKMSLSILACAACHLSRTGASDKALIGVGGISEGRHAYARILAGADLIQLYTALSLNGPFCAQKVLTELQACLSADGLKSISAAKGQMKDAAKATAHSEHVWKISLAQSANS